MQPFGQKGGLAGQTRKGACEHRGSALPTAQQGQGPEPGLQLARPARAHLGALPRRPPALCSPAAGAALRRSIALPGHPRSTHITHKQGNAAPPGLRRPRPGRGAGRGASTAGAEARRGGRLRVPALRRGPARCGRAARTHPGEQALAELGALQALHVEHGGAAAGSVPPVPPRPVPGRAVAPTRHRALTDRPRLRRAAAGRGGAEDAARPGGVGGRGGAARPAASGG